MKLFKSSLGFVFSFGFDMRERKPSRYKISWCDPVTGDWEPSATNQAGDVELSFTINPEFVFESRGGIMAYQPGKCIELTFIGGPDVWNIKTLSADLRPVSEEA